MSDTLPLTIKETREALLSKKLSVAELTGAHLKRIDAKKSLNAFLTVTDEKAFESAARADELLKNEGKEAFKTKPLLGIPLAHKDLFLTKGIRTTASSKVLESYVPQYSSTVVEKLDNAGGILLGKLNCDAWAHGASGENSDFGPTKNPWNEEYVPGGSSSGSATSLAAGLATVTTGTDTGGSIRQPANFCGVVGFKPTYGAVSRYGVIAMASSLDTVGHFTRTVEDARLVFDITKGEDGKDSTLAKYKPIKVNKKISLGIPKEYFGEGLDKEVKEEVERVIKTFEKEGVEIKEVSLPHTKYAISVYYIIQPAEVSSNLGRYDGVRFGNGRESFGDEAKRRIMLGTYALSSGYYDAYYLKAMKVRTKVTEDFDKAFEEVDALITPVSPTPPFKFGEKADDPLQMYLADVLTVAANVAGIPGLSVPSGFSKKGLPLGFQLLAPRFGENTLFDLGEKYQEWTNYKPGIAK